MAKEGVVHPEWFKFETGFRFLDGSGDECVVLGQAGYREYDNPVSVSYHDGKQMQALTGYRLEFKKGMVFAFKYKGEWHLGNLFADDHDQEWWSKLKPIEN